MSEIEGLPDTAVSLDTVYDLARELCPDIDMPCEGHLVRAREWVERAVATTARCGRYEDHDWSQTGSPSYCRDCHTLFPTWSAAQKRALSTPPTETA